MSGSGAFNVNFEPISSIFQYFLLVDTEEEVALNMHSTLFKFEQISCEETSFSDKKLLNFIDVIKKKQQNEKKNTFF